MLYTVTALIIFPDRLELLADADEMYENDCTGEVLGECIARLDLNNSEIVSLAQPMPLYHDRRLEGIAVRVVRGITEIHFPADTLDMAKTGYVADRAYVPRDCDALAVTTGKTCKAFVVPSIPALQKASSFGVYDIE